MTLLRCPVLNIAFSRNCRDLVIAGYEGLFMFVRTLGAPVLTVNASLSKGLSVYMRKHSPLLARFAKALGLPSHSACQATRFAKPLGLPSHSVCQGTRFAKALSLPRHSVCQGTRFAKALGLSRHSVCRDPASSVICNM